MGNDTLMDQDGFNASGEVTLKAFAPNNPYSQNLINNFTCTLILTIKERALS